MMNAEETRLSLLHADTLRQLLQQLEATDVDELEVVCGSSRLYLRRELRKTPPTSNARRRELLSLPSGIPVLAPLTGVFYARPAPDQPPYAAAGEMIVPGQIVGLIETMKLFNEVTAEVAGEVLSVTVQEGDLVEAGQPLMYLKPPEGQEKM
jgi:acetyl-CoA carboxylase biotin carboxyl carrier protein